MILKSKKIKSVHISIVSPSICHELMWLDAMILVFNCWVLSQVFHSLLSPLARGSLLFAIRVVSSAYLRHFMFLLAILIPAFDLSSLAFHMMYSAYKLNKPGDNIQSLRTPFPILNKFVVPCLFLTVVSWPAYRYLRRQVRSLRIFHSLLWSTQSKILV